MDRAFEGVWIPKEIWLDPELSMQEKVLLTEIKSLSSTERGCFASNEHFAKFLGLSKERARKYIASLVDKGYVQSRLEYKEGTKEVKTRWLTVTLPYGHLQPCPCGQNQPLPMVGTDHNNNTSLKVHNKSLFSPPAKEEVKAYCKAQGYHFNSDEFYDYYASANWHKADGKPVRNWKQCCVTWESTWKKDHPNATQTTERRKKLL